MPVCFFYVSGDHRDLHVLTHSFPTRRSSDLKQLEEQLGARLFSRNTKQVKLTKAGELLFQHVEQAYNFLRTGERSISELNSLQQGEIKIAASDTICKSFLLPYLKQFHQLYPKDRKSTRLNSTH